MVEAITAGTDKRAAANRVDRSRNDSLSATMEGMDTSTRLFFFLSI